MLSSLKRNLPEPRYTKMTLKKDRCQHAYLRALAWAIGNNPDVFIENGEVEDDGSGWSQTTFPTTRVYENDPKLKAAFERLLYQRLLERYAKDFDTLYWKDYMKDWTYDNPGFLVYWAQLNTAQFAADCGKNFPYRQLVAIVSRFTPTALSSGTALGEKRYPVKSDGTRYPYWVVSKQTAWQRVCRLRVLQESK